jgi:iron complex outermembrane recepter protein
MNQQQRMIWAIGSFLALMAGPAWANSDPAPELQRADIVTSPTADLGEPEGQVAEPEIVAGAETPVLSQVEQPAATVEQWLTEIAQAMAQITAVRLETTADGVELVLEASAELAASSSVVGNALIVDIPNAMLALPDGGEFQAVGPAEGIALVSVTALGDGVRVAITGAEGPPTATVNAAAQNLVLNVARGTEAAGADADAIQVVVTGEQDEGYAASRASTATRTDTPLRDIPQSIQVVPQQVLEDQQVIRASEALRNVSGVQRGNATGGGIGETFNIRGFQQFGNNFRDGFRDSGVIAETANLERIEVLRGPASVLYGNLDPGGIVNYVTKQPLSEPFYEAALQVGSFGLVRPTIDLSGPLNPEQTVLYRLNTAYERGGNFRDFDTEVERFFISPVVTWSISDHTDLTFEFEYVNDQRPFDRGLVAFGTGVADIPFDRVLGELDDFAETTTFTTGYRFEHRFNDNWTVRNRFRFATQDYISGLTEAFRLNETTGELSRGFFGTEIEEETYALQTDVVGDFFTGSIEHRLLFGIDLSWQTSDLFVPFAEAASINIFNPVYGVIPRPARGQYPVEFDFFSETQTDSFGLFVQDQVTLAENLKLLVGGRFDILDQTSTSDGQSDEQQDQAFSPRVGIVYQPIEPVSLYTSFSRSFQPNSGTRVDGSLLEPVRGTQYEVGVRGEFLDGSLITNLAAYEITVSNLAVTDPDNIDFLIPLGEQRSRGIELDVTGEIFPGWNIIASYAYIDARITKDDNLQPGNLLNGVPFNSASLWSTYEIQTGDFQGLGFGLGLFYMGERQGDLNNSFQIPSYVRTDASVFYRRDNWRAAININNLFNVDYIEATQRRTRINPGAPFTVRGTVSVEF